MPTNSISLVVAPKLLLKEVAKLKNAPSVPDGLPVRVWLYVPFNSKVIVL